MDYQPVAVAIEIELSPNDRWMNLGRQYRTTIIARKRLWTGIWWISIVLSGLLSGVGMIMAMTGLIQGEAHHYDATGLTTTLIGCGLGILGLIGIIVTWYPLQRQKQSAVKRLTLAPLNILSVLQIRSDLLSLPPKFISSEIDLVASGMISASIYQHYAELRHQCYQIAIDWDPLKTLSPETIQSNSYCRDICDRFNQRLSEWNVEWERFRVELEDDLPNPIQELV